MALLERLGLPFETFAPNLDESRLPGESPRSLVLRLAEAKARSAAERHPEALIIGSDQVACIDDQVLGKPGDREHAREQLRQASGRRVDFHTGLCLYDSGRDWAQVDCIPFEVRFRRLSPAQIDAYIERERPFACAGGFKSEGLGIALFERLRGDDPNALVGLPLIRLVSMLEAAGRPVLRA